MSALDFLRYFVGPFSGAVIGGLVVHLGASRRDVKNERRRQKVDYLVGAYRTLARSAHRDLSGDRAEQFEDALSEIMLLGTKSQIDLARRAMTSLADRRSAPLDELLVSIRTALRDELAIASDGLQRVPIVRFLNTGQPSGPLTLDDAWEVNVSVTAATLPATAGSHAATLRSTADRMNPDSENVQVLRELAASAPGASVVNAYGTVTSALKQLLDAGENARSAPELAQVAADRGLVNPQFVQTVEGLAVLESLSRKGGAGTGLTVEQANEYIDLVVAALLVLRTGRS